MSIIYNFNDKIHFQTNLLFGPPQPQQGFDP